MTKCSFGIFILSLFLVSCSKNVYLENMLPDLPYDGPTLELKIQKGDQLVIVVNAKNAEVAAPFNIHSGVTYKVSDEARIMTGRSENIVSDQIGYIVSESGLIDFPILGELKVQGLTCLELEELIKKRLIKDKYIAEPLVQANILNAKIDVMGEVGRPGALSLNRKGMNLLQALSLSGGLTNNGIAGRVRVIRQVGGVRTMYEADVRTTELFDSPCFVLQQNDLVYVLPRSGRMSYGGEKGLSFFFNSIECC